MTPPDVTGGGTRPVRTDGPPRVGTGVARRRPGSSVTGRRWGWSVVAAVVAVGASIAAPWLVDDYTTALLARMLVLGLVGVSVAVLTGVAGLPTLGQTGPFAAGAYGAALLGLHTQSVGLLQLLAGAAAGVAFAALTVPLVVYARGVVVLMITLAIGELVGTAASRWKPVTGGTDGLAGMPAVRPVWGLPVLDSDRARYLYTLVVVGLVVAAVVIGLRGPLGLLLRGCRDDERRMRASGHPVTGYLSAAYLAAGAIAGIGGSLLATVQQYISPADFGFDISALLLLGVVIGGAASAIGALFGTALVIAVRDWTSGLFPGHTPLLLGGVFVVAAYLLPRGLAGRRSALAGLVRLRLRNPGPGTASRAAPGPSGPAGFSGPAGSAGPERAGPPGPALTSPEAHR